MTTGIGYFPALPGTTTAIYFAVERGSHNRIGNHIRLW